MPQIRADEWATLPVMTGFHQPSSLCLFILFPLVNPPGPNVVPFLLVSISAHQKKGEHMSKSCGLGGNTLRH